MDDRTSIAWTDYTFNPWMGCTQKDSARRTVGTVLMKFWHRKGKDNPEPDVRVQEVALDWPEVFRRAVLAEKEIFTMADDVIVLGVDPVGKVFAAIIVASSQRMRMATEPDEADALILGFSCPGTVEWEQAFPDKTVVAMIDKNDERFAGKWIVLPWKVHHTIQKGE